MCSCTSPRRVGELTCCTYGEYIYFTGFNGTNPDYVGLRRIPIPSYKIVQPILVATGGKNLVKANCFVQADHAGAVFAPLTQVGGQWVDGTQVLTPPGMGDRLIKIDMTASDPNAFLGLVRVSNSNGTGWNDVAPFWTPGNRIRRFRGWVLDGSKGRKSPNKTFGFGVRYDQDDLGDGSASGVSYSCGDRWCPLTRIIRRTIPAPPVPPDPGNPRTGLVLGVGGDASISGTPDDNYGWFLIGEAMDGIGSISYPQPPEQDGPDEKLAVAGFGLSHTKNWSFRLAGIHPTGNWDQYADRTLPPPSLDDDRRWPLFTLWGNSSNQFIANCQDNKFRVKVNAQGTISTHDFGSRMFWLPDATPLRGLRLQARDRSALRGREPRWRGCPGRADHYRRFRRGARRAAVPGSARPRHRQGRGQRVPLAGRRVGGRWNAARQHDSSQRIRRPFVP